MVKILLGIRQGGHNLFQLFKKVNANKKQYQELNELSDNFHLNMFHQTRKQRRNYQMNINLCGQI